MGLKHLFEKIEPHFTEGKLKKYYQTNDDSGLVCGLPGHVLGDV